MSVFDGLMILFVFVLFCAMYTLPSWIAGYKHRKQFPAIMMVNLLLGWTIIGWIIALVWAFMED